MNVGDWVLEEYTPGRYALFVIAQDPKATKDNFVLGWPITDDGNRGKRAHYLDRNCIKPVSEEEKAKYISRKIITGSFYL